MKIKVTALLLSLCLVYTLFGGLSMTAAAADDTKILDAGLVDLASIYPMGAAILTAKKTIESKPYINYKFTSGYGRASLPIASEHSDWSGAKYFQMEVVNEGPETNINPNYFISNIAHAHYGGNAALRSGTASVQAAMNEIGYVVIPEGFSGTVAFPLSSDTSKYHQIDGGANTWALTDITHVGIYFNAEADISIGDYTLLADLPVTSGSDVSSGDTSSTAAESTPAKPDYTVISDIAGFSSDDITTGDGQAWGLNGSKTRIDVAGASYIKIVANAESKAVFPMLDGKYTDWTNARALDIPVINNKDTAVRVAPYLQMGTDEDGTQFISKAKVTYLLIASDGSSKMHVSSESFFTIPANFKGHIRMFMTNDGANYMPYWGAKAFDIKAVTRVSFAFMGAADISVGDFILRYAMAEDLKDYRVITCIDCFTPDEITHGDGQSGWGLPNGSKSRIQVGGDYYIKVVSTAAGRAIFPPLPAEYRNWTDAKALEIPIINNTGAPVKIAPYFMVGDETTAYVAKENLTLELVSGGKTTKVQTEGYLVTIPANFNGSLRMPVNNSGSNYQPYWGTTPYNIKNVLQVSIEVAEACDISIGDFVLYYPTGYFADLAEGKRPHSTGDNKGMTAVVFLLAGVMLTTVIIIRKRKKKYI